MRVPQPDIIEHFGNADAVPQPPERCLSRQAGIVRRCPNDFIPYLAAPRGTPIIASASGTVVTATYHNSVFSYGNYVILDHGDGYRTLYAHMSAFAVKQGDVVQQGQIIGYVGDTGYSFGCHCHFEMFGPGGRFSAQLLFPTL